MTVPTVVALSTAAALSAEATEYQAQQVAARNAALAAILAAFAALEMKDALTSWTSGIGERIYVLLSILQELIVVDSAAYIRRLLGIQGLEWTGPLPNPASMAGIASDMRDLESLLAGAVIKVREAQRAGLGDEIAYQRGVNFLTLVTATQAADTSRAAESVSLVSAAPEKTNGTSTREVQLGWVRMLNPPSCSRCAILAGRFYKWNEGFERHDMCDCRHIPVTESISDDLTVNPHAYFDSLSESDQNKYFGKAVANAIREGADLNQVVNAATRPGAMFTADRTDGTRGRFTKEGTTRRGYYGRGKNRALRPTPWEIYHLAGNDKEEARRLLDRFGYTVAQT